jgi:hypothetical protein
MMELDITVIRQYTLSGGVIFIEAEAISNIIPISFIKAALVMKPVVAMMSVDVTGSVAVLERAAII